MHPIAIYATDAHGTKHELIAGQIDERLIPGFVVMFSRFRHYFATDLYIDRRQCVGYTVRADGQFCLQIKQVPNG